MIHALLLAAVISSPVTVHVRVDGDGFMRFAKADKLVFGSEVTFTVQNGILVTVDGAVLLPRVHVPVNASKVFIDKEGHISAYVGSQSTEVGRVVLAMLPQNLATDRFFTSTQHPRLLDPGEETAGVIRCSTTGSKSSSTKNSTTGQAPETQSAGGPAEIDVQLHTELDKSDVTLGDIAKITGPKDLKSLLETLELQPAPEFGNTCSVSTGYVSAKIRSLGLRSDQFNLDIPRGADMTRAGQVIPVEEIINAANTAIKEKYDVGAPLKPDSKVFEMKVPKGDISIRGELGQVTDRSVSVLVVAEMNGHRFATQSLVLVPDEAQIGVKAGDQVTICVCSHGATVELMGTVRAGGWIGSTATVVAQTGVTLTGKVISSSVVEVHF